MTDEMMSLQALLEKSSDTDLLREMIGFAAHRLMELEVESLTGAARGERSAELDDARSERVGAEDDRERVDADAGPGENHHAEHDGR